MREFRGKHNGEWIYGGLLVQGSKHWIIRRIDETFSADLVDPETVGQYIGIKDGLTDEKWCEGDILTPNTHAKNQELQVICYDINQGRYKGVPLSAYELNAGNGGWTGFDIKSWQKRIGNIHDNPELLAPKEGAEQ